MLVAATVLAPVAGAQPTLAPAERGDLALVPYYTVLDEWVTGLHIVNTSARTQVVKLRFRRATDGMDALDFNVEHSYGRVYTVPGTVFRDPLKDGGQGPPMVVLPTGSFRMGSPSTEAGRDNDEGPVRTVTISRRLAMGRYEVTFAEYDRFADAGSSRSRPADQGWGRGSRPVINVSQEDAQAYATWLSEQTGKNYRLPSEAEWEYAARAGTSTRYSGGDEIGVNRANCDGCGSEWDDTQTAPVGSFAANAFGLYDLHGNVWEWVEDCWHINYEGAPTDGSAWTTGCDGSRRRPVVRGGSWRNGPRILRAAYRSGGRRRLAVTASAFGLSRI